MFQTSREGQGAVLLSVVFNTMMTETSNKVRGYNKAEHEIVIFADDIWCGGKEEYWIETKSIKPHYKRIWI